jgi:hypothetical protein
MAGEIRLQATTGLTVTALIVSEAGTVWSGSALVLVSALSDANWLSALVECTEQDTSDGNGSGLYLATWPGALTQSAIYSVIFYSSAAAPTDLHIGTQDDPTEYADSQLSTIAADLPNSVTKNTALANFAFLMVSSTDHITGSTGLTITAERSIDGAAFAACANSATELTNGIYTIDLDAADLNGDTICLKFAATGADTRFITIITQPT